MLRKWLISLAFIATSLCRSAVVIADEVVLNNGDRITGKLVELADGKLSIKTDYAGTLKIDWTQVRSFSTDRPVYLKIDDNEILATVSEADSGTAILKTDDLLTSDAIELSRVRAMSNERKPTVRMSGYVNIGASSASGNTNNEKVHGNTELVARSDKNRFTIGGRVNQTKENSLETESNWLAYLQYDHFFSKKWYAFASANAENDKFKDIKLRTTLGAGAGYQFFDTNKTKLSAEIGLSYVNTDFETAQDENYPAARWALNFAQKLFDTKAELFHHNSIYSSLDEKDDYFLRSETGLRLPVIERLNSTIQYNYDYDNDPAPGRVKEDKAWLFTLGYWW